MVYNVTSLCEGFGILEILTPPHKTSFTNHEPLVASLEMNHIFRWQCVRKLTTLLIDTLFRIFNNTQRMTKPPG